MRRKILATIFLFVILAIGLVACGDNINSNDSTSKVEISYFDGVEKQIVEVEPGNTFSIQNIPQKKGYTFSGLFDIPQYSSSSALMYVKPDGSSVTSFKGNSDKVLYPHWKPEEWTIVYIDKIGEEIEKQVKYNDIIPTYIPQVSDNYVFTGWIMVFLDDYGELILDEAGEPIMNRVTYENGETLPNKSRLNYNNYNLEKAINKKVCLYATTQKNQNYKCYFKFYNDIKTININLDSFVYDNFIDNNNLRYYGNLRIDNWKDENGKILDDAYFQSDKISNQFEINEFSYLVEYYNSTINKKYCRDENEIRAFLSSNGNMPKRFLFYDENNNEYTFYRNNNAKYTVYDKNGNIVEGFDNMKMDKTLNPNRRYVFVNLDYLEEII